MSELPCFRLGLTMAGAVSGGAYTCGVLDFLLEALDVWERSKAAEAAAGKPPGQWPVPPHDLRLESLSGTSAGSLCTALLAVALQEEALAVPSVRGAHPENKLYRSWVEEIHVDRLLGTGDLDAETGEGLPPSLLDGSEIDAVTRAFVGYDWKGRRPPWLDPGTTVELCVTNLSGQSYGLSFQGEALHGEAPEGRVPQHVMRNHADVVAFRLAYPPDTGFGGELRLGEDAFGPLLLLPADEPDNPAWDLLRQAALASGAFPLGLPARRLELPWDYYERRRWTVAEPHPEVADALSLAMLEIAPSEPSPNVEEGLFKFLCVDGGVINNEPFELVRRRLAGGPGLRNPREADKADRAVVMIDPFPDMDRIKPEKALDPGFAAVLSLLVGAAVQSGRFKPEEVFLAQQADCHSRFMIAPVRSYATAAGGSHIEPLALAAAPCAAFGGFLSRDFRAHDFRLGRRNCQRFLARHFLLAEENPLFREWSADLRDDFRVTRDGRSYLPIVPLLDNSRSADGRNMAAEVALPTWPSFGEAQMRAVEELLDGRLGPLGRRLIDRLPRYRGIARLAWGSLRLSAVEAVGGWVRGQLHDHGLAAADLSATPPPRPGPPDYSDRGP